MADYHPIALPIVVIGTAIALWAGYKAGQKNSIPLLGGGAPPAQLPPSTTGGIDTSTLESDATDAVIFNIVSDAAPALL
jgi:hypothetical protein